LFGSLLSEQEKIKHSINTAKDVCFIDCEWGKVNSIFERNVFPEMAFNYFDTSILIEALIFDFVEENSSD
jgi:hypothetical protein